MLVKFGLLNNWQKPAASGVIGPAYNFKTVRGKTLLKTQLKDFGTTTFIPQYDGAHCLILQHLRHHVEAGIIEWDLTRGMLATIFVAPAFRHSGLAATLTNLFFRSLYENGTPLSQVHTTRTMYYDDSDASGPFLFGKFGINSYRQSEMKHFFICLANSANSLSASFASGQMFLDLFSGREKIKEFHRIYSPDIADLATLTRHLDDRAAIAKLVTQQRALVGLRLFMEPTKVSEMEHYAASLPANKLFLEI